MKFKHLFLLTSPPDHNLGIFSVKLSHPMVAIPEHEILDSKEVIGDLVIHFRVILGCRIKPINLLKKLIKSYFFLKERTNWPLVFFRSN